MNCDIGAAGNTLNQKKKKSRGVHKCSFNFLKTKQDTEKIQKRKVCNFHPLFLDNDEVVLLKTAACCCKQT